FADVAPSVSAETSAVPPPSVSTPPAPIPTRAALPSNIGQAPAGPSLMSGEVVRAPKRRRGLALGLGAAAVARAAGPAGGVGAAGGGVWGPRRRGGPPGPPRARQRPPPPPPRDRLARARAALDADDLDGAARLLAEERARHDSVELQLLLGESAEKRGN